MKLTVASAVAVACMITLPAAGRAQTCLGAASFSAGVARIGVSGSFTDGAKQYGGELAVGAPNGLFGSVDAGQVSYDGESAKSTVIGVGVGYSISAGTAARFCPLVTYSHTSLTDDSFGPPAITSHLDEVGFGGAFGVTVPAGPSLDLVPFASAEFLHAAATESFSTDTQTEDYGVLAIGAGFVFSKTMTVRPNVSIPLGLKGAKTAVGIALAINFGHAGAAR